MKRNFEWAINELTEMADVCNKVRHKLQLINPTWKGLPLEITLRQIINVLLESRLKEITRLKMGGHKIE